MVKQKCEAFRKLNAKTVKMKEIFFVIQELDEGGYTARAVGQSIITEADDLQQLKLNIKEVLECHFENEADRPKIANLHFVKDEILTFA